MLLCVRGEGNYLVCTHSVVKEGGTVRMLPCNQAVHLRFKLPHCHLKIGECSGWAIAEEEPQITRCCLSSLIKFFQVQSMPVISSDLYITRMHSCPVNTEEDIHLKNSSDIYSGVQTS